MSSEEKSACAFADANASYPLSGKAFRPSHIGCCPLSRASARIAVGLSRAPRSQLPPSPKESRMVAALFSRPTVWAASSSWAFTDRRSSLTGSSPDSLTAGICPRWSANSTRPLAPCRGFTPSLLKSSKRVRKSWMREETRQ